MIAATSLKLFSPSHQRLASSQQKAPMDQFRAQNMEPLNLVPPGVAAPSQQNPLKAALYQPTESGWTRQEEFAPRQGPFPSVDGGRYLEARHGDEGSSLVRFDADGKEFFSSPNWRPTSEIRPTTS